MPNQTEAGQHRGRWTELQVPKLENGEILSRGKEELATGPQLPPPLHSYFAPDDFAPARLASILVWVFKLQFCIWAVPPS